MPPPFLLLTSPKQAASAARCGHQCAQRRFSRIASRGTVLMEWLRLLLRSRLPAPRGVALQQFVRLRGSPHLVRRVRWGTRRYFGAPGSESIVSGLFCGS